jgi:integrase
LGGTAWTPETLLQPTSDVARSAEAKSYGFPLSDAQILQLIDNLREGDPHKHLRFAIQLCAVYGLRLEELRHLGIKSGAN